MIKNLLIKIAYYILNKYNINYVVDPEPIVIYKEKDYGLSTILMGLTRGLTDQVEKKFSDQSGEFKRHQVLRAVMNSLPGVSERDVALAIELVVRGG